MSLKQEVTRFAVARMIFASVAFVLACVAMGGWVVGRSQWRSLLEGGSDMKPNTALCLMLLGLALVLREWRGPKRKVRWFLDGVAGVVGAIGVLTLLQYAADRSFGIDEFLFLDVPHPVGTSYPGRMSPPTAWCLILGALALVWLERQTHRAQWLALAMVFVPGHILLSYLYGNMNLLAFGSRHSYMAVPTACGLISLGVAILLIAPRLGVMRTLTAGTQASRVFRWLLLALLAVPPALGWLVLVVFGGRHNPPEFGVSTTVMLCVAILAAVAWFNTTRLNRAEHVLRESEVRFRLLIERAPNAMLMVDDTGAIRLVNAQTEKLFGYTREALVGQRIEMLVPARYRPAHPLHRAGFLSAPSSRPMGAGRDLFGLRNDGTEVPIEIGLNPLRIGERTFVVVSIIDITERKRAAAALHASEERFALFMRHLPGAAWMKDTEGRYVFANEMGERVFRTPLSVLRNKTDEEIFPPEIAAQFRANDRRALEGGQGIHTIETLPQPDGVHYSVVSKFPIFGLDGTPILVGGVAIDITERKRAEELLREHSYFTRSVTDTAPVALFRLDADNRITFLNPAAARMFGWSESELVGRRLHETLHSRYPDGRPYAADECPIVAAGLRGALLRDHEDVYFHKDGRPVHVLCSAAPIRTDGVNQGSVLAVQDITERKRAEETIRTHEAQIRLITDITPVLLTRCNRELRYEFVNRAYAEMLGLAPEQIIGRSIPEVVGEDAYATILPYLERVLQGHAVEYEAEVPFARVGSRFLRVAYMPERDIAGHVRGWIASISDITDRKQSEDRSIRLNETLLSMLEAIPDIVFVTEADGRIQFENPAAERFASSVGMGGELPAPIHAELRRVLETGRYHLPTSLKTVHRFLIHREERFFLSRIVPMSTPDERVFGAVVMLQDVTEFRLLDEVKTSLISTVSHELKTPMTSLRTALLLLLEQSLGPLNARQAEMAGIARDEAERLLRTLNELLDLTRFDESAVGMRLEPVPPAELVRTAVEETRLAAEAARISVRLELAPDVPCVQADRERIVHVLTNLLTNAIAYSPPQGEIVVRVSRHDHGVIFNVIDRGRGVPHEYQSRVFERFVRVPGTPRKGVGLGLSIAREFVRAHRGHIGVRSEPGQGSDFYFMLPTE